MLAGEPWFVGVGEGSEAGETVLIVMVSDATGASVPDEVEGVRVRVEAVGTPRKHDG